MQRRFFGGRIRRYELAPDDGGTLVRESWALPQEKGPIKGLLAIPRYKANPRTPSDTTPTTRPHLR